MILAFSESSIIIQWGFLELNMVSVIPLLVGSGVFHRAQAGVKYFISQSPASVWLLVRIIFADSSFWCNLISPVLIFKLGLPPCHGWVFSLIDFLGLKELCLLLTLQKILPILLLESSINTFVLHFSMISTIVLVVMALFAASSLKPVLLLTSVSGAFWPLSTILEGVLWLEFFFVYSFFIVTLGVHLFSVNVTEFSDMLEKPAILRIIICAQFLNLGGLPPFSGFFLKLFVIKLMIIERVWAIVFLLILSFLTLYLYLQLCIALLLSTPLILYNEKPRHKILLTLFNLPLLPFIFYF